MERMQVEILSAGLMACAANAAIDISLVDDGTVVATNLPPTAISNVWNGTLSAETNSAMFRIKAVR